MSLPSRRRTGEAWGQDRSRNRARLEDELLVECWCQREYVYVDRDVVMRGETGECGPRCHAIYQEGRSSCG